MDCNAIDNLAAPLKGCHSCCRPGMRWVRDGQQLLPERDSSKRVLTGCFLFLLIFTTLLGNTLVCAAVTKFRHLRSKVTNFFVISLAISDLLVAILVMPWKAATEIVGFWPFGAFCNVWVAFDIMCSTASILNLCVISVDRYWAISSPFRYERKMTPRVACLMISMAWTLSVLISFIPVQLNWHKAQTYSYAELNGTYPSNLPPDNCDSSLNRTYAISSSLISFYIPVAIMIVTYTRIYRIAQKQIRRISALERAAESAKNRHSSMGNSSNMESESSSTFPSFERSCTSLSSASTDVITFLFDPFRDCFFSSTMCARCGLLWRKHFKHSNIFDSSCFYVSEEALTRLVLVNKAQLSLLHTPPACSQMTFGQSKVAVEDMLLDQDLGLMMEYNHQHQKAFMTKMKTKCGERNSVRRQGLLSNM
ncbi:D(1)-like dopamine receptor [Solea senegalensis]|uniref:D(1)-like dopamine receptor n=1 Tax=Solea senegalensis TaxID=28829 RepID=A0AAV6SFN1_SOLSE|nr:D(1)-like dopamine receptor [Solea senegalensis]